MIKERRQVCRLLFEEYGGGRLRLRPEPRRSGTTSRWRFASGSMTGSNMSPLIPSPCTRRSGGPDPRSVKDRRSGGAGAFIVVIIADEVRGASKVAGSNASLPAKGAERRLGVK